MDNGLQGGQVKPQATDAFEKNIVRRVGRGWHFFDVDGAIFGQDHKIGEGSTNVNGKSFHKMSTSWLIVTGNISIIRGLGDIVMPKSPNPGKNFFGGLKGFPFILVAGPGFFVAERREHFQCG